MGGMDWFLEIALIALLALTLVHAVRLERALGLLRRDRAALGEAVAGLDSSTRQAETGLGRLHLMTQEATQQATRTVEGAAALREDLAFLAKRGEELADRLEQLIRAGRTREQPAAAVAPAAAAAPVRIEPAKPAANSAANAGGVSATSGFGEQSDLREAAPAQRNQPQTLRVSASEAICARPRSKSERDLQEALMGAR